MNEGRKRALAERFARLMLDQVDTLNGLMIIQGEGIISQADMTMLVREALTLIEEGTVQ